MNRKWLSRLFSLLLIAVVLAACSGPAAQPPSSGSGPATSESQATAAPATERKVITMWFWGASPEHQQALTDILAGGYNASQSEYELVIEFRNTVDKDIPVALSANQGPDIVYASGPSFTVPYVEAGKVLNLDKYAEKYHWKDRVLTVLYNACTVKGSLYSIPNSIAVGGIYYSKPVLKELGFEVPKTIEEVEAIMDAAMAKGMYGSVGGNKGWRPVNDNYMANFLNSFADPIDIYNALTGVTPWNTPKIKAAVDKSAEWYKKGYLAGKDYMNMDANDAFQLMAEGRSPFFFGPSLLFQFAEPFFVGDKANDLGFIPMPSINPNQPQPVYSLSTPSNYSINANSKHPDAAAAVLDRILTQDFLVEMTKRWPGYWGVPIKNITANPDDFTGLAKTFLGVVKDASAAIDKDQFGFHPTTFFPPATQEKWRDVDSVWQGSLTSDELLNAVDKEFKVELEKGLVAPLTKPAEPTK